MKKKTVKATSGDKKERVMDKMEVLKVGDFVKHKKTNHIIFQVVEILDPVDVNDSRMIVCNRVKDVHSYLEMDIKKYKLTADDSENIINHDL